MFIDRLRESASLCEHPNDAFEFVPATTDTNDVWIRCQTCQYTVSVVEFLTRRVSPLWSPTFARELANETGLVNIPCQFHLNQFPETLLPEMIVTRLSTILRGYDILKAIHSPFIQGDLTESHIHPKLFRTLMTEFMALINRVSSESSDKMGGKVGIEALQSILTNMKDAFSNVDMFDQYFNILAPYVKRAAVACQMIQTQDGRVFLQADVEKTRAAPLGIALDHELLLSAQIRKHFSRYCVPFDVVHAIVLCYLCGDNVNVVYNIVLDLTSKLCRGFFSFPISNVFSTGIEIQKFLKRYTRPTEKNRTLYYHRQKYAQKQGIVDDFSEDFLRCYGEMESSIRKHVPLTNSDDKIERFIYQQTFPYMLFENNQNDFDYYAFVMALAHYASKSTMSSKSAIIASVPGTSVPKGVIAECKHIYRFVKKCMTKVNEFHIGKEKMYWTKEMFELFMASDPDFTQELIDIIEVMAPSK